MPQRNDLQCKDLQSDLRADSSPSSMKITKLFIYLEQSCDTRNNELTVHKFSIYCTECEIQQKLPSLILAWSLDVANIRVAITWRHHGGLGGRGSNSCGQSSPRPVRIHTCTCLSKWTEKSYLLIEINVLKGSNLTPCVWCCFVRISELPCVPSFMGRTSGGLSKNIRAVWGKSDIATAFREASATYTGMQSSESALYGVRDHKWGMETETPKHGATWNSLFLCVDT